MHKNIAAYTAPDGSLPAFVSINEREDGSVEVHVRAERTADGAEGAQASLVMPRREWVVFASMIETNACGGDPSVTAAWKEALHGEARA